VLGLKVCTATAQLAHALLTYTILL
jgi:hypothetical protein